MEFGQRSRSCTVAECCTVTCVCAHFNHTALSGGLCLVVGMHICIIAAVFSTDTENTSRNGLARYLHMATNAIVIRNCGKNVPIRCPRCRSNRRIQIYSIGACIGWIGKAGTTVFLIPIGSGFSICSYSPVPIEFLELTAYAQGKKTIFRNYQIGLAS